MTEVVIAPEAYDKALDSLAGWKKKADSGDEWAKGYVRNHWFCIYLDGLRAIAAGNAENPAEFANHLLRAQEIMGRTR